MSFFEIWMSPILVVLAAIAGFALHYTLHRIRVDSAGRQTEQILKDAHREAEVIKREAKLQARDEVIQAREEFEQDNKQRRKDLNALEARMAQRETNLDRRITLLDKKEESIDHKIADLANEKEVLIQKEHELEWAIGEVRGKLQEMARMTEAEARTQLLKELNEELKFESAACIRRVQEDTRETAEREARDIITTAIERYAADQTSEVTTCTVSLPSDDMKGRIIGREGRNIRALEAETGCNILIDDTPEVVVVSGFDPLRREIARITLERLIADGRIHPARIEEVCAKVQEEVDETIRSAGEQAIYELGLRGVAPELVKTIGRLKFRHSYSQNVLQHSIEMAHLMGMMAADLNLDQMTARRVGLFHDIGKAIDHMVEGGHAMIGADLLKKHGELAVVYNAVASHHGDVEGESLYAVLASAADAITAARPGARNETTEVYLKRLEQLEEIATNFRGVNKSYAIQAGRELRVIVEPHQIDDHEALQMARNISKQIEELMQYPGQIKVTVIRETRCIEYAK